MASTLYRDFHYRYDPPPIPTWQQFAWVATHDNYDPGDPEVDGPGGPEDQILYADSEQNIRLAIDDWHEEQQEEEEHDGQPDEAQEWHDYDPDC
jgi:hypothetical protein